MVAVAAYVAVHFRGPVLVVLKKDAVTLGGKTPDWHLEVLICMDVSDVSLALGSALVRGL